MLKGIVKFELSKYIYSNRLIIFFIVFMSYLCISYSIAPQKIESAFSRNATMIYIVLLCCGVIYDSVNYDMVEQALLVKIKNKYLYYIGRIIALLIIALAFSLLSVIYMIAVNCIMKGEFFDRKMQINDVLLGIFICVLYGLCGAVTGLIFNKHIIEKKYIAIALASVTGAVTLLKGSIIKDISVLAIIKWIFPPLHEINIVYFNINSADSGNLMILIIWLIVYIISISILYLLVMIKKGIR